MTIRAIILDFGGVITRTDDKGVKALLGLDPMQAQRYFRDNPVLKRSLIGQATREEAYDDVLADVQRRFHVPRFVIKSLRKRTFGSGQWDEELLDFVRQLRPRYKTALLSDAWLDTRAEIAPRLGDTFDLLVISAEEGVAKPDPEIYRRTLARLGVEPHEAIFVDDWPPNVEGANALGIHGILFESSEQARAEIQRLLQGD